MMSPIVIPRRKDGGLVTGDEYNHLLDLIESLLPLPSATVAHKWTPHGVSSHVVPQQLDATPRKIFDMYDLRDNGLGQGKAEAKLYAPYAWPLGFITRVTYTYTAGGSSVDYMPITIGDGTSWSWWVCQKLTRTGAATGTMEFVTVELSGDTACPELNGSTDVQYFPLHLVAITATDGVASPYGADVRGANHFTGKGVFESA